MGCAETQIAASMFTAGIEWHLLHKSARSSSSAAFWAFELVQCKRSISAARIATVMLSSVRAGSAHATLFVFGPLKATVVPSAKVASFRPCSQLAAESMASFGWIRIRGFATTCCAPQPAILQWNECWPAVRPFFRRHRTDGSGRRRRSGPWSRRSGWRSGLGRGRRRDCRLRSGHGRSFRRQPVRPPLPGLRP
ncbi:Hypothetical protein NGAL_HAMBI1145_16250 [Neorhizobium galegae bv. officinalis]|uniref:Uncharacterized protein n=1 Tax=Neorhizobium galegae bv. officinalis TaxID=323656 RepID=A0A0T7FDE1_NEOGA|nr:Hypothetical protein NGAL_HAMBI1145_16250 [Neorhizobium galegae bv. officinalis]